jgi:hypothetical protein
VLKKLGIGSGVVLGLFVLLILLVPTTQPAVSPVDAPASRAEPGAGATATAQLAQIGQQIKFPDGWTVTVQKLEDLAAAASPRASTPRPDPGFRFVVVTLRFDNGTSKAMAPQPSDFKLQDSNGVRRGYYYQLVPGQARPDVLKNDDLAPGGFVVGTLLFPAPVGDRQLTLVYEPSRRVGVLVRLY